MAPGLRRRRGHETQTTGHVLALCSARPLASTVSARARPTSRPSEMAAGTPDRGRLYKSTGPQASSTSPMPPAPRPNWRRRRACKALRHDLLDLAVSANLVLPVGRQAAISERRRRLRLDMWRTRSSIPCTYRCHRRHGWGKLGPCGSVLTTGYHSQPAKLSSTTRRWSTLTTMEDLQEIQAPRFRSDHLDLQSARTGLGLVFVDGSRTWATNSIPNVARTATIKGRQMSGRRLLPTSGFRHDFAYGLGCEDGLLARWGVDPDNRVLRVRVKGRRRFVRAQAGRSN